MMKRLIAILMTLCLLPGIGAVAAETEKAEEFKVNGIVIMRNRDVLEDEKQKQAIGYPTFEGENAELAAYLTDTITTPFLALRKLGQMADDSAYADGKKDLIWSAYTASVDFEGVLSVEMAMNNMAAGETVKETTPVYHIIDLTVMKELTVYDLFDDAGSDVDAAITQAVFDVGNEQGLISAHVKSAEEVPLPNSYLLRSTAFHCIYAAGTIAQKATVVDIPWERLPILRSAVLTRGQADSGAGNGDAQQNGIQALQEDGTPITDLEALMESLTASSWQYEGATPGYLRFEDDGLIVNPMGGELEFIEYYIDEEGALVLDSQAQPGQRATVSKQGGGLLLSFQPGISPYTTLFLAPIPKVGGGDVPQSGVPSQDADEEAGQDVVPQDAVPQDAVPQETLPPAQGGDFQLPPVTTPTPMPVSGADGNIVDLLTRGLWKQMGEDGNTYYQFTADGKLLIVNVENYTVQEGVLTSDTLSGEILTGGDTAFTLRGEGGQTGFVLNRAALPVSQEEFVTASPTPAPTPTPEPTATPTAEPTAEPTPTMSPYEMAKQQAPSLAALGDAGFEKAKTLPVHLTASEEGYRESKWQVTTDENVGIYGVENGWVLVSYPIGNGSKGRMGYIETTTLENADQVAQLSLGSIDITLTKDAAATDDPLYGKAKLVTIKKGTEVKLLAFMGSEWAYVETTYKDKPCRLFIPQASLMAE